MEVIYLAEIRPLKVHHLVFTPSLSLTLPPTVITMANIQQLFGELERHIKREEHDKVLTISDKSKYLPSSLPKDP